MSDPLTRDDLIDALESLLDAQLRAIRSLRAGAREEGGRPPRARSRTSNTALVESVLSAAGEPLHVSEIIVRAKRDHGVDLKRESIVSALTKKVLDRNTFRRAGRNVFGLLEDGKA